MVEEARELDWLIDEQYVPSSVERKKAVLMYFFVGIIVALSQEKVSVYEFFHLKQALGWWMIFFISMIIGIIFIFIPYLWIIPLVFFVLFLVVWVIFTKQAREWKFTIWSDKVLLPVFSGLWERIISIFDIEVEKSE